MLIGSSRRRDGTSKANGYVNGTATFGPRRGRGEAYELNSADECEFGTEAQPREGNTFWMRNPRTVLLGRETEIL
jgi:hypothetical protein